VKLDRKIGLAILTIVLFGIVFQRSYINDFPSHMHAWAQSDRYAIAKGFVNNGLNFFKPETFTYNHQFPHGYTIPSQESVTAVDFPIHDYVVAVIMKLLGTGEPWVFRLYIVVYSFLGLFYLFKISKLLTDSVLKSLLVVILGATSPLFVYYQGGFLPTIPSLANAFIGIYFYLKFIYTKKDSTFNVSVLFLTLGALSRTTFVIPLIAVFSVEILRALQNKSKISPKLTAFFLSVSSIFFYVFYNSYLREQHGSIFLNYMLPPRSFQEVIDILNVVKNQWLLQYFSTTHYLIFGILVLFASIAFFRKKININQENITGLLLISVMLIGCISFSALMLRQFIAHDYYFLDTFFLPIMLVIAFVLSLIPRFDKRWKKLVFVFCIVLVTIPLILNATESQSSRRVSGNWDRVATTVSNFHGAEQYLDSLGVPADAKILVIDAYAPNIPFLLMNRKGFVVMSTKKDKIKRALTWNYDYVVVQNQYFVSDVYRAYPEITSKISKRWDNGRITICVKNEVDSTRTLVDFLGLSLKKPVAQERITFDSIPNELWQQTNSSSNFAFSGQKSGLLSADMHYGLTYKSNNMDVLKKQARTMMVQSFFLSDSTNGALKDVELIVAIAQNGNNTFYQSYNIRPMLQSPNHWEQISLLFELPKVVSDKYELAIFLGNTGKSELYVDDFEFKIY
jgi:hypothetical protein